MYLTKCKPDVFLYSNIFPARKYHYAHVFSAQSSGAALKKPRYVRLEHVIEYGELLSNHGRGYCFMDTPGNDLEGIAGQVYIYIYERLYFIYSLCNRQTKT